MYCRTAPENSPIICITHLEGGLEYGSALCQHDARWKKEDGQGCDAATSKLAYLTTGHYRTNASHEQRTRRPNSPIVSLQDGENVQADEGGVGLWPHRRLCCRRQQCFARNACTVHTPATAVLSSTDMAIAEHTPVVRGPITDATLLSLHAGCRFRRLATQLRCDALCNDHLLAQAVGAQCPAPGPSNHTLCS